MVNIAINPDSTDFYRLAYEAWEIAKNETNPKERKRWFKISMKRYSLSARAQRREDKAINKIWQKKLVAGN
jgi:hypothetical protein